MLQQGGIKARRNAAFLPVFHRDSGAGGDMGIASVNLNLVPGPLALTLGIVSLTDSVRKRLIYFGENMCA